MAATNPPAPPPSGSQPNASQAYGFTAEGSKRIVNAVRRIENQFFNGSPGATPPDNGQLPRLAMTGAGGIPARVGAQAGNAQVTLQTINSAGKITATSVQIPVNNLSTTAVGASKYIIVVRVPGSWLDVWEDC